MAVESKTFLDDRASLDALVERMPEPFKSEYKGYGAMVMESAFPSRKMLVYTLQGGQPTDIDVITFGDFRCDWETGPNASVDGSLGRIVLTTEPVRYGPRDVFLHLPQNFILKYKGRQASKTDVDFVSHYAVLIKTRSKEIHQVEGHTYCVTPNKFRERFPESKQRL